MIRNHSRQKLSARLNSESKKTYERTYHKLITVTLSLASIMTSILSGQNYAYLALFLLNHVTSMNRSHLNQNYETLHIENIITYITYNWPPSNLHFLEVVMIKSHCRLKLSAKLNSECKKRKDTSHGNNYNFRSYLYFWRSK